MKIAFCTEDRADQEILLGFLKRIAGLEIEAHAQSYRIERGGWTKALQLAPVVARAAHRSALAGAVFAIDNDAAEPLHDEAHDASPEKTCRHCALRAAADVEPVQGWPRPGLPPLFFVFVVPVRTIETWLALASEARIPGDPQAFGRTQTERRTLKRLVYDVEKPDTELMIERGAEIVGRANLEQLEQRSVSFRNFAAQARRLRPPAAT